MREIEVNTDRYDAQLDVLSGGFASERNAVHLAPDLSFLVQEVSEHCVRDGHFLESLPVEGEP